MTVAFFSTQSYDRAYFERFNASAGHRLLFLETPLNEQTATLVAGCEAVCIFVNDQCNAEVIKILKEKGIRLIALRCAGFNNVDIAAAKAHGIPVVRVPAYSPHAVAEHTVALILTLNRKTHKAYNRVREGNFSLDRLTGFDLYGKTVGVVGTGKIGSVFAQIMLGFGCRVLAFDVQENAALVGEGVRYVALDELLAAADIVSLHCPLNEHTRHLINAGSLKKMKHGAMLINTGRGALIDTKAVVAALKSGRLGHLGLDVYEQEEHLFFQDHSETIIQDELILRLMSFPNVLITAHQAFFTDEALSEIATVTLQNITDFEKERPLANEVGM
ncbi:MAG: 2-hydroxyacid dehydrogenase [Saprospiraceae bacterium]|nr:2-hydroxyacid dehydrogenase [Saprospiraceae bacterium]